MHLTRTHLRNLALSALHDTSLPIAPLCTTHTLPFRTRSTPKPNPFHQILRPSTSSSSSRWLNRASRDPFTKQARVAGLKSRAAYKLLQLSSKHRIFSRGATVVDLGFAPGSWSQVAIHAVSPGGRVVGVDMLPATPPRGVSTIQGNFLSPEVQDNVRDWVRDTSRGRIRPGFGVGEEAALEQDAGYLERAADSDPTSEPEPAPETREHQDEANDPFQTERKEDKEESGISESKRKGRKKRDEERGRVVDVVLSDMCEPWPQTTGGWIKSISDPYSRLMNTSGIPFRDHAGSMDLCYAALSFCYDTLKTNGHFVCKFYQGNEDKLLEKRLKRLFVKVHRDKPAASRSESREGYFVAMRRKEDPLKEDVFAE